MLEGQRTRFHVACSDVKVKFFKFCAFMESKEMVHSFISSVVWMEGTQADSLFLRKTASHRDQGIRAIHGVWFVERDFPFLWTWQVQLFFWLLHIGSTYPHESFVLFQRIMQPLEFTSHNKMFDFIIPKQTSRSKFSTWLYLNIQYLGV